MDEMSMVDRVAMAIYSAHKKYLISMPTAIIMAHAALSAMREPTSAMANAGFDIITAGNCSELDVWCGMIDAALARPSSDRTNASPE